MTENELYHHGILGMKWGVRRYQNKDGSLTPLGKKHLRKLKDEVSKLEGTENKTEHPIDTSAYRRRDVKKLTDTEINERIERLKLEKKYKDALPDDRSRGKKFVQDILGPALKKGVKDYTGKLVDSASDALGTFGGKKIKDAINERLGVKKDLLDSSQYRLSDMDNLTTEQLKARNERMKEEKSYREHFLGESKKDKSSDNNSGSKNDKSESSNNNSDSKKSKNENQNKSAESKREDEESKEQRTQVSDSPKVKTSDYDVDNDKNYYRVPSRGEHDMVIYRRQPVIDFTSRYEEAALSEVRPSSSGRSFVEERLLLPNPDNPKRMRHSDMETWRDELYHHGIKGQKWGVRRFQNPDGTLTEEGKKRLGSASSHARMLNKLDQEWAYSKGDRQYFKRKAARRMNKLGFTKMAQLVGKGKPTGDKKLDKYVQGFRDSEKDMKRIERAQYQIIASAVDKKYAVFAKETTRLSNRGWNATMRNSALLGGAIGAGSTLLAYGVASRLNRDNDTVNTKGNLYKVTSKERPAKKKERRLV